MILTDTRTGHGGVCAIESILALARDSRQHNSITASIFRLHSGRAATSSSSLCDLDAVYLLVPGRPGCCCTGWLPWSSIQQDARLWLRRSRRTVRGHRSWLTLVGRAIPIRGVRRSPCAPRLPVTALLLLRLLLLGLGLCPYLRATASVSSWCPLSLSDARLLRVSVCGHA